MTPIATVPNALPSVDLRTLHERRAHVERSDTCAVPAAGIVAEAMVCLALADALLEALGGDTMQSLRLPFARLRIAARARLGHVFLLGPSGAGKTSAGLILAHRLDRPFIDLDARIEARAGTSIAEIFRTAGEAEFRRLESLVLDEACDHEPAVVALGGGAVVNERAWRRMREAGVTVRLHAPPFELLRRIRESGRPIAARPLLAEGDPAEKLAGLVAQREQWYARADLHLDTTALTAEEVAGAIVGLLRTIEGPLVPLAGGAGRGGPMAPQP
jgi:shikimate kinase